MLPLRSPFDAYRAGLWAAGRNFDIVFVAAVLIALFDPARTGSWGLFGEIRPSPPGVGALVRFVVDVLVPSALTFALHATFLSDGRRTGFMAVHDFGALCLVGLRWIVITVFAFALAVIIASMPLWIGGDGLPFLMVTGATVGDGASALELEPGPGFGVLAVLSLGLWVILLGLRIPEIVDGGTAPGWARNMRRGVQQSRRMAASLAAGPGLLIAAYHALWWVLVPAEAGMSDAALDPVALAGSLGDALIFVYAMAMTSAVLANGYRHALAEETAAAAQ